MIQQVQKKEVYYLKLWKQEFQRSQYLRGLQEQAAVTEIDQPSGRFTLRGLSAGSSTLAASATLALRTTVIAEAGTTGLTITLGATGTLSGTIRLPDGGAPTAGRLTAYCDETGIKRFLLDAPEDSGAKKLLDGYSGATYDAALGQFDPRGIGRIIAGDLQFIPGTLKLARTVNGLIYVNERGRQQLRWIDGAFGQRFVGRENGQVHARQD